ncbi:hypothetical protein [Frigidibacter oleivorans]|uniref:hypothetical protein n=1 Tax=Frigidibacter oleivorans TaxID=2487129 RepID=UPI000F8E6266|nr:hypothetical protein [Frigidibacter oleivorans]
MREFLSKNWERVAFSLIGGTFLAFSIARLYNNDLVSAAASFGMALLSFVMSKLSRFKKIKGFGIEAELWEDTQKEAADLIERLRVVVSIYTREVVLGAAMRGRWGASNSWRETWKLYDDLVQQHNELGQKLDFGDLEAKVKKIFVLDIMRYLFDPIHAAVVAGRNEAQKRLSAEFGPVIKDHVAYSARVAKLREIPQNYRPYIDAEYEGDVAGDAISWAEDAQKKLRDSFGVDVHFDEGIMMKLRRLSREVRSGTRLANDEWIDLVDRNRD